MFAQCQNPNYDFIYITKVVAVVPSPVENGFSGGHFYIFWGEGGRSPLTIVDQFYLITVTNTTVLHFFKSSAI